MIKIWWVVLLPIVLCSKLNVPRVLLPLSPKYPVNFTLEVADDEGCFSWSSSRPDVVVVIPVADDNSCSRRATLVPTGLFTHKTSAIVVAKNLDNAQVLRCDVIMNHIHSLQISMKTHELFIEDAPEEFTVRAWDDQGNEFSSISDLQFEWKFGGHPANGGYDGEHILRWVKFEESSYLSDPVISRMEKQGLQGHTILIEGVKTGSTTVSVRLKDEFFKNVPSIEAKIIVQANLIIEPSEVYVLPGSTTSLTVYLIRQGKANEIHLPSSNYYLKTENSEIASVHDTDSLVKAGKVGTTRIFLLDRNMESPDVSHVPHVLIHVVYPQRLALKLLPYLSWTTMFGETHTIQVEMYDEVGNFIMWNDFVRIETDIPSVFVENYATNNGSFHHGVVKGLGSHEVKASLKSIKMPSGADIPLKKALETSELLTVLPRITLKPSRYVLAWDHITAPSYRVKYSVINGGESNEFLTSNTTFAVINANGEATTRGPGSCSVSAHPAELSHLKAHAKLFVLPVSDMTVPYQLVEIEVGSRFDIPVFMKGLLKNTSELEINDCSKVPLEAEFTNPGSFEATHTAIPREALDANSGCRSVSVTSSGVGVSTLTLSLQTESTVLQQRVTISSYHPLRHLRPRKGFATLAVDSCYTVVLRGGPTQSTHHPADYFRKVLISNETVVPPSQVRILNKPERNQKHTEILACCNKEGEADVRYAIGSTSTAPHMHLAEASISTKIFCVYPHQVSLLPSIRRPAEEYSRCKEQIEPNRYAIQNYIDSKIEMAVEDKIGRRLDNYSSYKVQWTVSDANLGVLKYVEATAESEDVDIYDHLNFHPLGKEGLFVINLSMLPPVTGDNDGHRKISGVLELNAVNEVSISPSASTILNHPNIKLHLKMLGGSGHYRVQYEPADIALVKHYTHNKTVEVSPLESGNLEISTSDRCLWSPKPATVSIQVIEISRIHLQVADKVELGSSVTMTVQMYDASDNLLDAKDLHSIQLEPVLGSSIVRVKSTGPLEFLVEGIALGDTTVAVRAANRESPVVGLQVFPPLKISPRNLTLVVGATFQVVGIGGPQPDTTIQYSIDGVDVASCSYNGIITARKLGRTKVRARAVGVDRFTGLDRVYSEDEAEVHVKPLSGVRIVAPMTRVRQGTEMPISFAGLDDAESPFAFGDSNPSLKVEWAVTNALSGTIHSLIFDNSKFALGDSDIAVRFTALEPGETVIKLKVTSKLDHLQLKAVQFTDELTVHVYEALTVTNLNSATSQSLLMMPNTTLNLKTSITAKKIVQSFDQSKRIINIDNEGNLRSQALMGHNNLLLTSTNGHGITQNLNLFVEVRPVSYLLPTATGILWDEVSKTLVIPRGFVARILVTYHDSLGRTFHGVRTDLKLRASRQDNHRISYDAGKSLIAFEGDHPGTTVLHIYDDIHQSLGVYVKLNVINAITPEKLDLGVGDVICFDSPLLSSNGIRGKWSSSPKFLDIDGDSGVAVIAHEGLGHVKYRTPDGQTTVRDVSISAAPAIRFHDARTEIITNADGLGYRYTVILRNKNEPSLRRSNCDAEKLESFFAQHPSKLTCHLSFVAKENMLVSDVFTVESAFDLASGFHQCIVKPVSPSIASPTHLVTQLSLKAQFGALSTDLMLTWEPAFAVKTPEINIKGVEETGFLEISADASVIKHLEFLVSDASVLKLGDKHATTAGGVKIPVLLNPYYLTAASTPLTIDIRNRVTDQTEKVVVTVGEPRVKNGSPQAPGFFSRLWQFVQYQAVNILTLAGTCMAIYLGYRAFSSSGYHRPQADGSFARTPQRSAADRSSLLNTSLNASYYTKRSPTLWSVPNEMVSSPFLDQSAHSAFRTSSLGDRSNYSDQ